MSNMINCLTRNVQRFVEYDLSGLVSWDQVGLTVPVDGDGNSVEVSFALEGKMFYIRIDSSDLKPPLGRITMDDIIRGPIDEATWTDMSLEIKAWHAAKIHKRGTGMRAMAHG